MALGKNEIRKANELYYCTTYFRTMGKWWYTAFAFLFVILWQFVVYIGKQEFLRAKYAELAGTINLRGAEVYDWIELQVKNNFSSEMGVVIILSGLMFVICIFSIYCKKNYKLYKYKGWSVFCILAVMIIEIILLILTIPEEISEISKNTIMYTVFLILQILNLVSNLGIFLPLELKKPLEGIGKSIGWITNIILKKI